MCFVWSAVFLKITITWQKTCMIPCNPLDSYSPCSSVHWISQKTILERNAISFSSHTGPFREWNYTVSNYGEYMSLHIHKNPWNLTAQKWIKICILKIHFDFKNRMQNLTKQYNYITNVWNHLTKIPCFMSYGNEWICKTKSKREKNYNKVDSVLSPRHKS